MTEAGALHRTARTLAVLQAGYVSFWMLSIAFSHTPELAGLVPDALLNTVLPAPLWMKVNVFIHGALYFVTLWLVFRRSILALATLSVALILNAINWVNSLSLAEYNGELGSIFMINGAVLLGLLLYIKLTERA